MKCPLWLNDDRLDALVGDPAATETMLEVLRGVERQPSMLGAGGHLLGRRAVWPEARRRTQKTGHHFVALYGYAAAGHR
ncbi:hypothetical protein GCM10027610_003870 [Dactylosporangium cerinum]